MSSVPLFGKKNLTTLTEQEFTIKLAKTIERRLNEYYNTMSEMMFGCNDHKFFIKGETIAKSGIWIAKKRYALLKTYDLEKDVELPGKLTVKGLDIIRSTFPTIFREYMEGFIYDILNSMNKDEVDKKMMEFYIKLPSYSYTEVARNTAASDVDKYTLPGAALNEYKLGTPMHIRACINYNKLIDVLGLEKRYSKIVDGEKIKYVLLAQNEYKLEHLAFKGENDPSQIISILKNHCDHSKMFDSELKTKLEGFYSALGWGKLPMDMNSKANEFFNF